MTQQTATIITLALAAVCLAILVAVILRMLTVSRGVSQLPGSLLSSIEKELASREAARSNEYELLKQELRGQVFQSFIGLNDSIQQGLSKNREESARSISALTESVEGKLRNLQSSNTESFIKLTDATEKKLTEMRATVDEKLQETLNRRLAESFKTVTEHLQSVQTGLGEMKTLASDVGGLKRALTNVKVRGTFGEVQLERILEQMLTPAQYEKNVVTKKGSRDPVEFAIKMPGSDGETVLMPIDSKFPTESYYRLLEGYDLGDKAAADAARKALFAEVERFARDISEKYTDPPYTTDFALLFLPTEGLYAEIAQNPELFERIQRKYKITITGPTTVSAFLNALSMGFRTLAIEKRSTEVWNILTEVKTEFGTFADALSKTQKKIREADSELDKLVGTRTNQMQRRLRNIDIDSEDDVPLLTDTITATEDTFYE
ncbi:MAG: DNA recombination protein RmuC [Oscillospiraceae bacterium]|jgi:DNA recombination protein RmuC|nr:DNA recombination protein RmuC [Oscillospiraceae bacterium]